LPTSRVARPGNPRPRAVSCNAVGDGVAVVEGAALGTVEVTAVTAVSQWARLQLVGPQPLLSFGRLSRLGRLLV